MLDCEDALSAMRCFASPVAVRMSLSSCAETLSRTSTNRAGSRKNSSSWVGHDALTLKRVRDYVVLPDFGCKVERFRRTIEMTGAHVRVRERRYCSARNVSRRTAGLFPEDGKREDVDGCCSCIATLVVNARSWCDGRTSRHRRHVRLGSHFPGTLANAIPTPHTSPLYRGGFDGSNRVVSRFARRMHLLDSVQERLDASMKCLRTRIPAGRG